MIFNAISMGGGGKVAEGSILKSSGTSLVTITLDFEPSFCFVSRTAFDATSGNAISYWGKDGGTMYGTWATSSHSRTKRTDGGWDGEALSVYVGTSQEMTIYYIAGGE